MRLSHLSAAAVLVALVAALFVGLGPASGHDSTGVHIHFDDSDDIVKAGTSVVATIDGLGDSPDPAAATTNWTVPLGLLIDLTPDNNTDNQFGRKQNAAASVTIDTTGAAADEYTITAVYNSRTYTRTLAIGDAGKGVGSVEVSLGQRIAIGDAIDRDGDGGIDTNAAAATDVVQETGTTGHPDTINVVVTTRNSLGETTNNRDVETIILFVDAKGHAEPGRTGNTLTADDADREDNSVRVDDDSDANDEGDDEANAVSHFTVGASEIAAIEVYAIVIGDGGTATSEKITLNFTGPAATISLGEASDALRASGDTYKAQGTVDLDATTPGDQFSPEEEAGITFAVTGEDKGGSSVRLTTAVIAGLKITDSADKDVTEEFAEEPGTAITTTKSGSVIVRVGTDDTAVAAGDYTLSVTLASDASVKATAHFHVAGTPAKVDVVAESSTDPVALGSVITVTATVTDASGIHVADGTYVDFSSGGALELDSVGKVTNVMTKDGVATARFIASKGSGLATIIVDASDTDDENDVDASGTTSVMTAAPEPAMAEEPSSDPADCLVDRGGYASWDCDTPTDASTIFEWASSRGATALHLWNRTAWVRYSVVDDQLVPGSMNFNVRKGDILYVSN